MVSVIVVTYNRKIILQECINSLLSQDLNEDFEIIIVDNCSADNTEEFVKRELNNRVKFIKNNCRLNISDCKKLGIKHSLGDIIAFIDDDCIAEKNWLRLAKSSLNNYDFVGGAVLPISNIKFPWWWRKSLDWLIGINTHPGQKYLPLGSNIVFRKYVLKAVHNDAQDCKSDYNQCLPYAEDNYRVKKALSLGFSMKINPDMIVYHKIPEERLKIAYLIKRSFNEGRALVNYENEPSNIFSSFVSLPYNTVRLILSLDINRIFRIISNGSYILHYIKIKLAKKCYRGRQRYRLTCEN